MYEVVSIIMIFRSHAQSKVGINIAELLTGSTILTLQDTLCTVGYNEWQVIPCCQVLQALISSAMEANYAQVFRGQCILLGITFAVVIC